MRKIVLFVVPLLAVLVVFGAGSCSTYSGGSSSGGGGGGGSSSVGSYSATGLSQVSKTSVANSSFVISSSDMTAAFDSTGSSGTLTKTGTSTAFYNGQYPYARTAAFTPGNAAYCTASVISCGSFTYDGDVMTVTFTEDYGGETVRWNLRYASNGQYYVMSSISFIKKDGSTGLYGKWWCSQTSYLDMAESVDFYSNGTWTAHETRVGAARAGKDWSGTWSFKDGVIQNKITESFNEQLLYDGEQLWYGVYGLQRVSASTSA